MKREIAIRPLLRGLYAVALAAMGFVLAPAAPAHAQDFTVQSGDTVGPQTMVNAGDTGTVEPGGTVNGAAADAVTMNNTGQTLNNGGSITTAGNGADGIVSIGADAWISNGGSITTTGISANGIFSGGANGQVTNSGRIVSLQSNAIEFFGAQNNILTLLPGSVLQGGLVFGGGTDMLKIGNGLSIASTFDKAPEILNAYGAPTAISGGLVAVVDPTNLAMQDEVLVGLTGGIFSTVRNRLNGLSNGAVSGVTANPRPMGLSGGGSKTSALVEDTHRQGWAQAFGSYRLQREHGPAVDADIRLGGLVSGFDGVTGNGTRAGFFLGGAWGEIEADFNSQDTDVESLFGGAYARWLRGSTMVDLALTVGYSDYDRTRRVANNLVAGGLQTARADYDGWFISPELTLTRPLWQGERRFEKSLTLRYAGLFLDGFTETGAAAPLTLSDRDIHLLQARTQLTMPNERTNADGSKRRDAFYIGVEGRTNVGDEDISGVLLAQNITFDPGGDQTVGALFAGLEFERTSASGTTFFASVEGQVETGGGRQASGKAGIKFRF